MQVDIVPIRKHELYQTQGIAAPRRLAHGKGKIGLRELCEIHRIARNHLTRAITDFQIIDRHRIRLQLRQIFFGHDGARHMPGGVVDHMLRRPLCCR